MANITRKPNGTFLIRVSNGMKNGRQDLVSTIYKPPVGSTSAMARKAAEKYAVLFEELVHSGGYEKKQAVSREIRARRRMTIEQFVQDYYYPSIQKHLSPTTCRTYELIIDSLILPSLEEWSLRMWIQLTFRVLSIFCPHPKQVPRESMVCLRHRSNGIQPCFHL